VRRLLNRPLSSASFVGGCKLTGEHADEQVPVPTDPHGPPSPRRRAARGRTFTDETNKRAQRSWPTLQVLTPGRPTCRQNVLILPSTAIEEFNVDFFIAAPVVWNSLPLHLHSPSSSQFRTRLKAHLFRLAFY